MSTTDENEIRNVDAIAAILKDGVGANIWYHATDFEDHAAAKRIEDVQLAMEDAAKYLPEAVDLIEKLWRFAGEMLEKHGMDGTDTLTPEQHALFQDAGGGANALLGEMKRMVLMSEAEEPVQSPKA